MIISQSKWPLQLRMPSRELQDSPTAPFGVSSTLLKRHKTLPHPRGQNLADIYPTPPASQQRLLSVDTGIPSSPTSQSSSPRTLKHASRRIGLPDPPPTPPIHSRQSSGGQTLSETTANHIKVTKAPSLPTTPTNHQSPPTPDVTPPRGIAQPAVSRPPVTHRCSSSRNDSFKTAKENFSSEDEDDLSTIRPALPSTRPSEAEVTQVAGKPYRSREIGLGLGLESDNDGTPSPKASKRDERVFRLRVPDDFMTFDGEWGSTGESEVEREWDHNLMRNVTVRRRRARDPPIYTGTPVEEVLNDNPVTPTPATKLLRRHPLQEDFKTRTTNSQQTEPTPLRDNAEHLVSAERDSPATPDIRRFSTFSARSVNSTVIEAMVVDALPQRRKTLRHTKKQLGLREYSSIQSAQISGADPYVPNNLPHRLVHKSSGIFSRKHMSVDSNATASTSSSAKSRRDIWNNGSIPVVVVPERRSSSKSAHTPSLRSTSSRRTKRSMSLNSAPLSLSSKANDPGYFEIPKRNPRRLSESAASSGDPPQRTIDFPPKIPVRRSSLSAPTSRNTSRAGSLTAESLRAHNKLQAEIEKPPPFQSQISSDSQKDALHPAPRASTDRRGSVDHNGDPFFGNRLSAQVTPFSQASYETTATLAEVAQATSVALYPHHNKSVLLVEQQAQPPLELGETSRNVVEQPKVAINDNKAEEPLTPPQPQQDIDEVDSPLRNPRDAPLPPAIKFIPPTPNNLTPAQEEDCQLGYDNRPSTADSKPKRGMSLIRRALSNRRRSISVVTRKFSTKRAKDVDESTQTAKGVANPTSIFPSVMDQPPDGSKLHPFWRPARFWDDLEDDDYELQYGDYDRYSPVDSRPALPKRSLSSSLKRTFAILPIRDEDPFVQERRTVRRTASGNLKVVKGRGSTGSLRRAVSDGRSYYTTEKRITNQDVDLSHVFSGIHGLGRRFSERKRERRNEKLRKTISAPRDAVDGVARVIASDSSMRRDSWVRFINERA